MNVNVISSELRTRANYLGQFFTPGKIAKFMGLRIAEINPKYVLDPVTKKGILLNLD